MKISEKIQLDYNGLVKHGPINIVAFGDSVTHGALSEGEISYETVYWNLLKKKINALRSYVPVNAINAGIGGITAKDSIFRIERDVLSHNPDLVIVCFGLNDVNGTLDEYLSSLETIFTCIKEAGVDVIFMTPNMLNTYVAEDAPKKWLDYAHVTAGYQVEGGRMDIYMQSAIEKAKSLNVTVCDCYGEWKKLSKTQDVTMLLANRINHPTAKMHELFASMLFDIIFENENSVSTENSSTMYNK